MTDLTPEAVKAALEAATPGPWDVDDENILAPDDDTEPWHVATATECCGYPFDQCWDNARLIAMAPDLARAYLAQAEEIERLRKQIDAADRLAAEAQGLHADGLRVTSRALDIALATYRATEAKP